MTEDFLIFLFVRLGVCTCTTTWPSKNWDVKVSIKSNKVSLWEKNRCRIPFTEVHSKVRETSGLWTSELNGDQ